MTYQASKKTDFTVDLLWWGSVAKLAQLENITIKLREVTTMVGTEIS